VVLLSCFQSRVEPSDAHDRPSSEAEEATGHGRRRRSWNAENVLGVVERSWLEENRRGRVWIGQVRRSFGDSNVLRCATLQKCGILYKPRFIAKTQRGWVKERAAKPESYERTQGAINEGGGTG
jgi:hypothetical protein